jgi:hypothetical protein
MARDRAQSQTILQAGAVSQKSDWIELTGFSQYTWTVRVSVTAATLAGTLNIRGTNNTPQDAVEPILITPGLMTALPANITYASPGAIVFASPAIATHEISLNFPSFPQFVQADWVFTSGGGTVDLRVRTAGW